MISLYDLILLFGLVLIIVYWWRSSEQHANALVYARRYCEEKGLQLLDQTLAFKRFNFCKDNKGRNRFCRIYEFDICLDGSDRYQGELQLSGNKIIRILLDTDQLEISQY